MVKRILFVVHRAAPFPGGSEIYVQNMAEEMLRRGYDVTTLAHEHQGDYHGVKMTNNYHVLEEKWDLIIVHGGDCISQNVVHVNAGHLLSPVLYMIIKPSTSDVCMNGLRRHNFIGVSSIDDWSFVMSHNCDRYIYIPHGIVLGESLGNEDRVFDHLKEAAPFIVPRVRRYYVSAGGFWPHKGMTELAELWEDANMPDDTWLFLFGYSDHNAPHGKNIVSFRGMDRAKILDFVAGAQAYVMNSTEEGFGLVLLEAMINRTPWISRPHAGARTLVDYGTICYSDKEMVEAIRYQPPKDMIISELNSAYELVLQQYLIKNTVDGIEQALKSTENDWK